MKLALSDGSIYIRNTKDEYPIVKGLPNAKYDKKLQAWRVPATADTIMGKYDLSAFQGNIKGRFYSLRYIWL